MKLKFITIVFLSGVLFVRGQGTFVWDQQDTNAVDGGGFLSNQPLGQSFTPSSSSIGVAAFNFGGDNGPVDIEVNVRSDSITGTILGTSEVVTYTGGGIYDFLFSDPVTLTPGIQYYLQPVVVGTGNEIANVTFIQYTGGDAIIGGTTYTDRDFWFQEGVVVVPEPSVVALFVVGGVLCLNRYKRRKT